MKRQALLVVLFCGGLWGLAEAALGGWMYAADLRLAAPVVLALIAFAILAVGRIYLPVPGSSTAIAALAMLFKLLNEPFFGCHLLAILLLGAGFDAAYSLLRGRHKPLIGAAGTYLGFALFAVIITYVVRYEHWTRAGLPKVLGYIGGLGTLAAACNAAVVPLANRIARRLAAGSFEPARVRLWATRALTAATAALWAFAFIQRFWPHAAAA